MSRFSGKFDFCDFVEMHGFDYIKNSDIYIGHSFDKETGTVIPGKKLEINSIKDIIPYYPHIISMSGGDKESSTVYLTEKSWPEMQREKFGDAFRLYDFYDQNLKEEIEKYDKKYLEEDIEI